jgi:hypothetical protein
MAIWYMYFVAILYLLRPLSVFCGQLVYFMVIWYIFPVLVYITKKNLATLAGTHFSTGHVRSTFFGGKRCPRCLIACLPKNSFMPRGHR